MLALHKDDVGSTEVQIGILSEKIKNLSEQNIRVDEVLKYTLEYLESISYFPDIVVPMEITQPFRPQGLIDNLIEVYVDSNTPSDVSKQLEPIVDGLVELLQGEPQGSPLIDMKQLMEMYYTEQFIRALERGNIAQA